MLLYSLIEEWYAMVWKGHAYLFILKDGVMISVFWLMVSDFELRFWIMITQTWNQFYRPYDIFFITYDNSKTEIISMFFFNIDNPDDLSTPPQDVTFLYTYMCSAAFGNSCFTSSRLISCIQCRLLLIWKLMVVTYTSNYMRYVRKSCMLETIWLFPNSELSDGIFALVNWASDRSHHSLK